MPFGNYKVNFSPVAGVPLMDVFGREPLTPSDMMKALWKFIKAKNLATPKKPA